MSCKMNIDLSGYSSIGDRAKNEDSVCYQPLSKSAAFMAVNDGLGGHGNGQIASSIAAKWLSKTKEVNCLPAASKIVLNLVKRSTILQNLHKTGSKFSLFGMCLS